MSGRESGRQGHPPGGTASDPDALEVVPGANRANLEGQVSEFAGEEELRAALESAFDYRGNISITLKDGSRIEGYVFDRRTGRTLADSFVRLLPKDGRGKISLPYSDIAALAFTGRDMAAGKTWENWVRQYWERKAAGEKDISLHPEKLD